VRVGEQLIIRATKTSSQPAGIEHALVMLSPDKKYILNFGFSQKPQEGVSTHIFSTLKFFELKVQ